MRRSSSAVVAGLLLVVAVGCSTGPGRYPVTGCERAWRSAVAYAVAHVPADRVVPVARARYRPPHPGCAETGG